MGYFIVFLLVLKWTTYATEHFDLESLPGQIKGKQEDKYE